MLFSVQHHTVYRYSQPVFLEPHTVRLHPRPDAFQRVNDFSIRIAPSSAHFRPIVDLDGNIVFSFWFDDMTASFEIETSSIVETTNINSFDFIVYPTSANSLPLEYPADIRQSIAPYIRMNSTGDAVGKFIVPLLEQSERQTLRFLTALTETIYREFETVIREEGQPFMPEQLLRTREGSCRDHTVLFMAAARAVGLAARFVSGYQEGDPGQTDRHLHAWPEVYIPGAGWRGFDPTHGLAVADRHIPLAAGATPEEAASVTGTFRGTGALAEMEHRIELEII